MNNIQSDKIPEEYLTTEEVAAKLKISKKTLWREMCEGKWSGCFFGSYRGRKYWNWILVSQRIEGKY